MMRENKVYAVITGAKITGELAMDMVWKSMCLPNVYVDTMKELVESLLADGHYDLCNSDFAQ